MTSALPVSRIGFGCYRVDDQAPGHREALERALADGCTLIDTSTNYTDGGSERLVGAVLQGAGTAMVYPTLLAAIADHAHPLWRASSLGVYRFWRDLGYAIGALLSGVIADALSVGAAIHVVAAITLASGLVSLVMMRGPRS